jgi:hypothetical protein
MAAGARPTIEAFPERLPLFVVFLEALLQAQRVPELREQLAAHYAEERRRAAEMVSAALGVQTPPDRMLEVATSFMIAVTDGLMVQALLDPDAAPSGDELAAFYEGLATWARTGGPPDRTPGQEGE